MKILLLPCFLILLLIANVTLADTDGRYRATFLQQGAGSENRAKVFIIDSEEGHMWTWEDKTKLTTQDGQLGFGTQLIYQGKVRPGSKAGEIVEQGMSR